MEIRLSPELAAAVERGIASGRYASAEEYVGEAIELLEVRDDMGQESFDEMRAALEEGWEQAERGELIPLDEALVELEKRKVVWREQRQTA